MIPPRHVSKEISHEPVWIRELVESFLVAAMAMVARSG